MENKKQFEHFKEIWKRVEDARPKTEGSARLMPRRDGKSRTCRFAPPT